MPRAVCVIRVYIPICTATHAGGINTSGELPPGTADLREMRCTIFLRRYSRFLTFLCRTSCMCSVIGIIQSICRDVFFDAPFRSCASVYRFEADARDVSHGRDYITEAMGSEPYVQRITIAFALFAVRTLPFQLISNPTQQQRQRWSNFYACSYYILR